MHVEGKSSAYRDGIYMRFTILTILLGYCFFHLFTILPVYYKTQWHLSEMFIGLLMAANGLIIVFIEMILVYSLEGKRPLMTYVRLGVFLIGVSYMVSTFCRLVPLPLLLPSLLLPLAKSCQCHT